MCFPGGKTDITRDVCFPVRGTHITRDIGFTSRETHITRDTCFLGGGTHITRDMWFPGREGASQKGTCRSWWKQFLLLFLFFSFFALLFNNLQVAKTLKKPVIAPVAGSFWQPCISHEFSHSYSFVNVKWAHSCSFNSVLVKCFHLPHRITWIHYVLSKDPWQRKGNELSFLLGLNLLFEYS